MGALDTDVIVIGGGVMGCAAAYHLAGSGLRALLLEQFAIGHAHGSSHGPSRIIRLAYNGVDYVQLARAAYALWHDLEAEAGERLLWRTGGFDFGVPGACMLDGIRATYQASGVSFETIDRDEIVRRVPQITLPQGTVGYYQPDYSILAADRCVATLAAQALRRGAAIAEGEAAEDVRVVAGGVEVCTRRDTYRAGAAVLCAGSWAGPLLRRLGVEVPLVVRKEQLAFFAPPDPSAFVPERFPLFVQHFRGTTSLGSGFPIFGRAGVKMMLDRIGPDVDADDPDRSVDPSLLARLRAYVARILPALGDDVVETVSCRYTMTPDEHFIIDRHPVHPQIIIASPCSGHGFKFAIVIGRIVADLAVRGTTAYPIERFRLDRPALRSEA